MYKISVVNDTIGDGAQVVSASLDGAPLILENGAATVPLRPDRGEHCVTIVLRAP